MYKNIIETLNKSEEKQISTANENNSEHSWRPLTENDDSNDNADNNADNAKVYAEPCRTSKMERFSTKVKGLKLLNVFTKRSILVVWLGSEYASAKWFNRTFACQLKIWWFT